MLACSALCFILHLSCPVSTVSFTGGGLLLSSWYPNGSWVNILFNCNKVRKPASKKYCTTPSRSMYIISCGTCFVKSKCGNMHKILFSLIQNVVCKSSHVSLGGAVWMFSHCCWCCCNVLAVQRLLRHFWWAHPTLTLKPAHWCCPCVSPIPLTTLPNILVTLHQH